MHTTLYKIPTIQARRSRRTPILAAASGLVAAGAIAVTLAVAGGGSAGDTDQGLPAIPPSATHAHPDRATFYQRQAEVQRGAEVQKPAGSIEARRAAERFHHFR
jgi:hypothetical protein